MSQVGTEIPASHHWELGSTLRSCVDCDWFIPISLQIISAGNPVLALTSKINFRAKICALIMSLFLGKLANSRNVTVLNKPFVFTGW